MDDLITRVHSLPLELFDDILEMVFTPDTTNTRLTLHWDYKPPAQLHVSRATREQFARAYYGTTSFSPRDGSDRIIGRFLDSLPTTHIRFIRRVHIPQGEPREHYSRWSAYETMRQTHKWFLEGQWRQDSRSRGLFHPDAEFSRAFLIRKASGDETEDETIVLEI